MGLYSMYYQMGDCLWRSQSRVRGIPQSLIVNDYKVHECTLWWTVWEMNHTRCCPLQTQIRAESTHIAGVSAWLHDQVTLVVTVSWGFVMRWAYYSGAWNMGRMYYKLEERVRVIGAPLQLNIITMSNYRRGFLRFNTGDVQVYKTDSVFWCIKMTVT